MFELFTLTMTMMVRVCCINALHIFVITALKWSFLTYVL